MADNNNSIPAESVQTRAKLGTNIVYFALGAVTVLGVGAMVAIAFAQDPATASSIKDLLSTLLPVLGTWVGTVLAFYFSSENFSEAQRQTRDLVRQLTPEQKLQETSAMEAMIPLEGPNTAKLVLDRTPKDILLTDLLQSFNSTGRNRLPVLDTKGAVKFVLHRSLVDKYLSAHMMANEGARSPLQASLQDLLMDPEYQKMATAFEAVGRGDSLIVAKQKLDSIRECADIFVTEDGSKKGKAIGWITNVIIAERARV